MATQTTERLTAEQARFFDHMSIGNALLVAGHFRCGCQPYESIFTFKRWIAQGFIVKRGEHGLRLPLVKDVIKEDKETGETTERRILGASHVFCRHQVEER